MSETEQILDRFRESQGWTDKTVLDLALTYIENQASPEAWEDYLRSLKEVDDDMDGDLGPRYVADAPFPQSPEEARTCEHGNEVWFGHECGLCDGQGQYRWHDDRECRMVPIGVEAEVGEWHQCVVHNYQVLGDAYVCEGYTPPPYVEVDHRPCVEAGEHIGTQRHPRTECPTNDDEEH